MNTHYEAPVYNLPLWRTAWRRLRRRPFQYLLLIFGVALGVAMTVSIDIASSSASRAFQLSTDAVTGRATHRIVGSPAGLDQELYRQLRVEAGIQPSAPVVEGYLQAEALGGQPLRLVGVDLFAEPPFRSYFTSAAGDGLGGIVPFLTQPNSVILSQPVAEQFGLELGDSFVATFGGQETPLTITGLLEPADEINRRSLSSILFTDISSAQSILGMEGKLSHIDLMLFEETAVAEVTALLPDGLRLETASSRSNTVQQMTAAFELNLMALSLLALVVGMFLIYNTVSFSVVQRRPLFGVLRCLGVTSGQLFRLILAEAAALSLIGSLLGLLVGVLLGRIMVQLVTQTINDIYFVVTVQEVAVPVFSLVRGLVIGVAAALVASAIPAWEAMQTTPQSTLRRSTIEGKAQALLPRLVGAWAVLVAIGTFLLWLRGGGLVIAFTGLFAILFGFALLTPPVTAVLMRWLTPVGNRLVGVLGRMAPRDIVRSLSRTSVAIAALMVAVSVIVGVSIMIGSFRVTVTQWLGDTLQADIFVSPPRITASQNTGVLADDIVQAALALSDVEAVITARVTEAFMPDLNRTAPLIANNGDISNGERQYAWLALPQAELWAALANGEGVLISEPLLLREGLSLPPEPITLQTNSGEETFPVLGVYYDYASDRGSVTMHVNLYEPLWNDSSVSSLGIFAAEGAEDEAVAEALQAALAGRSDAIIQLNQGLRTEALAIFDRTFAITAALRLLAVVVAFIGVLSALMSLQLERVRELGILRATGMTLRQLWQLTLLETGLMGSVAGLLAMPTGFVLAYVLIHVINVRSFGWTLQMQLDPGYFVQAFGVALIAALLAGIYPALRLGQIVIATAIRQE